MSHSVGRRFGSSGVPAGRWRGPGGPWVTRGPGKRRRGGGRALVVVMWPVVVAVVPGPGGALKASHPPSVCGLFLSRRPLWAGKKHRALHSTSENPSRDPAMAAPTIEATERPHMEGDDSHSEHPHMAREHTHMPHTCRDVPEIGDMGEEYLPVEQWRKHAIERKFSASMQEKTFVFRIRLILNPWRIPGGSSWYSPLLSAISVSASPSWLPASEFQAFPHGDSHHAFFLISARSQKVETHAGE